MLYFTAWADNGQSENKLLCGENLVQTLKQMLIECTTNNYILNRFYFCMVLYVRNVAQIDTIRILVGAGMRIWERTVMELFKSRKLLNKLAFKSSQKNPDNSVAVWPLTILVIGRRYLLIKMIEGCRFMKLGTILDGFRMEVLNCEGYWQGSLMK